MDPELKKLVDAPLADPVRLNIPGGRDALPRKPRQHIERMSPAERQARGYLTTAELRERKAKLHEIKLSELYDYYAKTDLEPERIAEHMGIYRALDEEAATALGVPEGTTRVLDVETVRTQIEWRRNQLRAGE